MNRVLVASKLVVKALVVVLLGAATLVLTLQSKAEPLAGQNQNTVLTDLVHDSPTKPQPQPSLKQVDTVVKSQHVEPSIRDDDNSCTVMCLLPGVADSSK